MNTSVARGILQVIEDKLRQVTNDICQEDHEYLDLEHEIGNRVHTKMENLSRSLHFKLVIPKNIEIKKSIYKVSFSKNGIIQGKIILEHCEKRDTFKYGGPGYPGRENGQLCVYPENSKQFYKWNSATCKWQDIYHGLHQKAQEPSWTDKLLNNAAFEPWWGANPSMDGIKSDRKRNGADELWGDPGVRKFGKFKQISADIIKSVYNFTYDYRKMLKFYEEIAVALGFEEEIIENRNIEPEEIKKREGVSDTTKYEINAQMIDVKSNKHFNGFRSDIIGYGRAQKDSAYHVNRSDAAVRIEVFINKKK